ncbi:MAG: sigma 54-interacting transcriptional regulator, partial [Syntrophales bacterium]|nr:sigma 54-interacting transcriptional regulator [Syntrophales bacterium]
ITEMAPGLQAKLLRFMQNGEVRRLGGHTVRQVTVRVVAATNRNIDEEIRRGTFRADLLYRFVVRLHIPPLREHREDLPQLVESLLKKLGYSSVRVSDEVMELFMEYDWPGNVRELQNVLQQVLLLSPFNLVLPEHLPERFQHRKLREAKGSDVSFLLPLEAAERDRIKEALLQMGWNISKTAQFLGIDRKTLRVKILRYGLDRGSGSPDVS